MLLTTFVTTAICVLPNVPPFFIGPIPSVIDVDEDSGAYTGLGFLTGMHTGEITGYTLALYPQKRQDWWLDIVIVEQHPPLPTELFTDPPKLTATTGFCKTDCPMGVCVPPICTPLVSNLQFTPKPEVSGYVIVEVIMKDSGGMFPGTNEKRERFRININDINDGVPTFQLSPSGTRKIEVYEDTCNVITGWVHKFDIGTDYEEFAGDTLDYQLFPSLGYNFQRDIFVNTSYPYQCGNATTTCPVGPTGVGHGHRGIDVTFPDGTLEFCLARNMVDTVSVTMTCIDQCFFNQPLKPTFMGSRDWPCWDPTTYQACPDKYFEISVIPVNDPPGRCPEVTTITVSECTGGNAVNGGCQHNIDLYPSRPSGNGRYGYIMTHGGGFDEANQQVDVRIESKEPDIYELTPELHPDTGLLSFKLKTYANTFGRDELTVVFHDDGGITNRWCTGAAGPKATGCPAGRDSTYCEIHIVFNAVNQPPLWTPGPDQVIDEDSGLLRVPGFASMISPGEDPLEKDQVLSFTCTSNPASMFTQQPTIEPISGDLELRTALNANGDAVVTCLLSDQIDSTSHYFNLKVNPVNDCPVLNLTVPTSRCTEGKSCSHALDVSHQGAPNELTQGMYYDVWLHPQQGGHELFDVLPSADSTGKLTYKCKEGGQGVTTVRITIRDDGGTGPPHCDKGEAVDLSITCVAHNRPPSFEIPTPQVDVWENHGAAVIERHATNINKGSPLEGWQTLTFVLTGYDQSMFTTLPAIDPRTGELTFEVKPDTAGETIVTAVLQDDGDGPYNVSVPVDFVIRSRPEAPPSYTPGGTVYAFEDGGPVARLWATDVDPGGLAPYVFEVSPSCGSGLLQSAVTVSVDAQTKEGFLQVHPAANANGVIRCPVCIVSNNNASTCEDLTIVIHAVNDPPTFTLAETEVTLQEDQDNGNVLIRNIIKSPSVGPPDEHAAGQFIRWDVEVLSDANNVLRQVPVVVNGSDVRLSLENNAWGEGEVIIRATDYQLNTVSRNTSHHLRVVVLPVNDAPYFTAGDNVTIDSNSGDVVVQWASDISAGAPDEDTTQAVSFTLTPEGIVPNGLFKTPPTISPDGALTISPVTDVEGVAKYFVTLSDTGSPVKMSEGVLLWITVGKQAAYRAPEWVVAPNATFVHKEDVGSVVLQGFGKVRAAPKSLWNTTYSIRTVSGGELFATVPYLEVKAGQLDEDILTLQYTAAANRFGEAAFEVLVEDDNEASLQPKSISIQLTPVNDKPSLIATNRLTVLHYTTAEVPAEVKDWVPGALVTAGPFEDFTQKVTFSVTNNESKMFSSAPIVVGSALSLPLSGAEGTVELQVVGEDDVPGERLKTEIVDVTIIVSEGRKYITTDVEWGLEKWMTGDGGGTAIDIALAKGKLDEAKKRLALDPTNNSLKMQVSVLEAELAALEGGKKTMSVGDMLRVQDENVFIDSFRQNISSSMGILPTVVAVKSVTKTLQGTQIIWSLPTAPVTDSFISEKAILSSGNYVNSTISTSTPSANKSSPMPPDDDGVSSLTTGLIITALVFSGLFLCVAGYMLYKKKKAHIKTVEE
eukprot:TRINITY_DN911_c1_g5_i1.p1 TRINITY_DN911_c1_g5~~TRINITY_DN911_c1_g5_i1.p1  ORF type:complete len:1556 (+),score=389.09 TRINITY_DN911_c1_g5_i1:42-4709(+)